MSEEKKYKNYTAADIEKYYKGLLTPKEMHELEEAALEDPFLADALEGYTSTRPKVNADLLELQQRLDKRITDSKVVAMVSPRNTYQWWKVAAAIIIIGGIGFVTFKFPFRKKGNSVAAVRQNQQPATAVVVDSDKLKSTTVPDTQINNKLSETASTKPSAKTSTGKSYDRTKDTVDLAVATRGDVSAVEMARQQRIDSTNQPAVEGVAAPTVAKPKTSEPTAAAAERMLDQNKKAERVQARPNYFNGRVMDANNNPLPFANITNVRDEVGTYADVRGYFTLISPDSVLNVRVRSIGFETGVARLEGDRTNQVVLQDDKGAPDKILSLQRRDSSRSFARTMKLEEPEPLDGWTNYNTYMANNVNVPDDARTKQDNGHVRLSFEVNQNGEPVNIKVEKSLCKKCDEEAVRLIKQGPKWKQKDKNTKRVTLNVPFPTE